MSQLEPTEKDLLENPVNLFIRLVWSRRNSGLVASRSRYASDRAFYLSRNVTKSPKYLKFIAITVEELLS